MNVEIPRVELPGLTKEDKAQVEAARDEMEWYERSRVRFLDALVSKRGPLFLGKAGPRRKPTKHQRHKAAVKVRSAYLKQSTDG